MKTSWNTNTIILRKAKLEKVRIGVLIPSLQTYSHISTDEIHLGSDNEAKFEEYLEAVRIGEPIPSWQTYSYFPTDAQQSGHEYTNPDSQPTQQSEANSEDCIPAVHTGISVLA